ncbi:MAG: chromosome partitioning protein ParB [Solirubrobacterales bacterium]|nr:chromosome partitioning protein ParB [Solirubrobacterales bacterium]
MDGGTGFPSADAQDDFSRARRSQLLAELGRRLRREPDDVALILPFDEVVEALGMVGEVGLGLRSITLDSIVGTVDRTRDFDRGFRPTTPRVRGRWQRIAAAQRRGESFPPISVYRIGDLHFVRDGHHRVSVAKSLGREDIDAYVTQVRTRIATGDVLRLADLPLKGHERLFAERVPLDEQQLARVRPSDPWEFGRLAEGVEAWGFRVMQERREYMGREEVARLWYEEDFLPVVKTLREGEFIRASETEGDAYTRVVSARYVLLRTHEWSDEIVDRLQGIERRKGGLGRPKRG